MIEECKPSLPLVILTGATSGLGYALCKYLISQKFRAIFIGRKIERINELVGVNQEFIDLIELDLNAQWIKLSEGLIELRRLLISKNTGSILFLNNASVIEPICQGENVRYRDIEQSIRVNYLTPLMIANTLAEITDVKCISLQIFNITSGASRRPIRGWQAYCSTKAAVRMGFDVLSEEYSHIEVIHFDPGVIDTGMQGKIRKKTQTDMPEVELFKYYQEKGLLRQPELVATEIFQSLGLWQS